MNLKKIIAEVIREHEEYEIVTFKEGSRTVRVCICGEGFPNSHADHLAIKIEEVLVNLSGASE